MRAVLLCAGAAMLVAAPPAHASWSTPVALADDAGAEHRAPAIARNATGEAVMAWVRAPADAPPGSGRVVIAERRLPGGAWTRGRLVSGPGANAPAIALGPRGAAVVAWGVRGRVHVATRAGRHAPWRVAVVADVPGHVTDLAAAADASGAMAVMWSEEIGARHRVRRATRAAGASRWALGAATIVAAGRPALAVGAGGNGVVAWTVDGRVAVSRLGRAGFRRPVAAGTGDSTVPSLALAAGGRLLAGWRTRLPGGTAVVGAAGSSGDLDPVRNLGDLGVGDAPHVALNDRGDAAVAWTVADEGGERGGVQALVARGAGEWLPVSVVGQARCGCRYAVADLAVDGAGGVVVAWRRAARRGDDVAAVSARAARGGPWRSAALRPVPHVSGVDISTDGTPGAAVIWSAGPSVRAMMRRGPG